MERLKALLYCLRCHLVLLTFIGLAAGGYWLREDLYGYFGSDAPNPVEGQVVRERAVGDTDLETRARSGSRAGPKGSQGKQRTVISDPVAVYQPPSARDLVDAGNFAFRPVDDSEEAAVSGILGRQELLTEARRAYWNGDIRQAVLAYQRLIEAFPDQPDYPGELGNIYYEQGARQLAASFYNDSARMLVERGERSRAEALARVLEELDPEIATALRELLERTAQQ